MPKTTEQHLNLEKQFLSS